MLIKIEFIKNYSILLFLLLFYPPIMFIRIKKAVILALNLFLPYFAYLFLVENYFILLKKYNNSSFVHYHLYSSSNQNKKKNFSSLWSVTLLLLSSSSFFCFFSQYQVALGAKSSSLFGQLFFQFHFQTPFCFVANKRCQ